MNKSLAGILGVTVALTLLAGCTAYDRTKDQFTQPVVKDVKKGMSRQQVMQIAGKPSTEVTMVHARGTCQTYILGQRDGKVDLLCGPRRNGARDELRLPDLRRV